MSEFLPDQHQALLRRIERELLDGYDEEYELEVEDRHVDQIAGITDDAQYRAERQVYFKELFRLQGELVKLQDWVAHTKHKVVVLFEGRDAAGNPSSTPSSRNFSSQDVRSSVLTDTWRAGVVGSGQAL